MKDFAEQLSDCLMRKLNIDAEIAAIVEAAKEQQINVKALKRVAREMCLEPAKLAKALDDEQQLDLFRVQVGLLKRKGLALKEAA